METPTCGFESFSYRILVNMSSDSASRGPAVIATGIFFTVLAVFFVATRFLARAVLLKNSGVDELAILGSLVRKRNSF
jgi:hypothetical protein